MKQIVFNKEAKQRLIQGIDKVSKAVICTLGPGGRTVLYVNDYGSTVSTKDGITVLKHIELEDPIENMGAELIKQAALNSASFAGDGTTTTTLLSSRLIKYGFDAIDDKSNVVKIKKGIEKSADIVLEFIRNLSQEISNEEQIQQVAYISANNDDTIGNLIAAAMNAVGADGVVTVEESKLGETSLEIVEGVQFDRGYKSPHFVTNNNTLTALLTEPNIMIFNGKINNVKELLPILEKSANDNKPLLIIAEDIEGEALATLIVNKMRGSVKVCAVKGPDYGDNRLNILEDIAIITGGVVVDKQKGHKLDRFDPAWFGTARVSTISKDDTTIVDGGGNIENISARIEEIKNQIEKAQSLFEREKLQDRLGKMTGGIAVINVGANTEVELKEKKDRIDDALHATKAALQEGILPGGGVALLLAAKHLTGIVFEEPDEEVGKIVMCNALLSPMQVIFKNSGLDDFLEISNIIIDNKEDWFGYDVNNKEYVDMLSKGILDPTKVTRCAIENAVSVAGTVLTCETIIYNPHTNTHQQPPPEPTEQDMM